MVGDMDGVPLGVDAPAAGRWSRSGWLSRGAARPHGFGGVVGRVATERLDPRHGWTASRRILCRPTTLFRWPPRWP